MRVREPSSRAFLRGCGAPRLSRNICSAGRCDFASRLSASQALPRLVLQRSRTFWPMRKTRGGGSCLALLARLSLSVRLSANSQTRRRALISYCAHLRQRNGTRAHSLNTAPPSGRHSCARGARARYTPASRHGTTPSITYRYPAGTHERTSPTALAPSRSTAVGRQPSPPLLPHHNS